MSTAVTSKGPPLFGLPFGGVAFGALWVAGAFVSLAYCFATNYIKKPIVPAEELSIANAAFAPGDHRPAPQP